MQVAGKLGVLRRAIWVVAVAFCRLRAFRAGTRDGRQHHCSLAPLERARARVLVSPPVADDHSIEGFVLTERRFGARRAP
jgi:hypothetical protein